MSSPVMVPCCGRSFSRDSLVTALVNRAVCPLCNASLRDFDAGAAPPNRSLLDAIERANTQEHGTASGATGGSTASGMTGGDVPTVHQLFTAAHDQSTNGWAVDIDQLVDDSGALHGAHLHVTCRNPALYRNEEQLLLLVLDISSSMHWNSGGAVPLDQAIFAQNALRDMASTAGASTNVRLATVAYNQHYILDPSEEQMRRGGGTSFFAAFQGEPPFMSTFARVLGSQLGTQPLIPLCPEPSQASAKRLLAPIWDHANVRPSSSLRTAKARAILRASLRPLSVMSPTSGVASS